ncbi:MAG: hypothetical protein ACP5NZ_03835 [Nanobdellota archaeon]
MDKKLNIKTNKKGDLPLTILVIGVFGVCTIAIFSFIYSSSQVNKAFIGVEIMENANIQIESHNLYHLYLDKKVTKLSPEWGFNWFKQKIIFSVEYNPQ